jgi:glycosyltransferase involved in cell wall biosynthesis
VAAKEFSQDMPSVTFFLLGEFSAREKAAFEASLANGLKNSGNIVEVCSTPESLSEAINSATSDFVSVVTEPLRFVKSGFSTLQNALARADVAPDVVYADSISQRRPDFSQERLRCQDYLGQLVVYRTLLLRSVGGFRIDLGAAATYDLALRATTGASVVTHVSSPIYQSARLKSGIYSAAMASLPTYTEDFTRALTEHLLETGGGSVVSIGVNGVFNTRRDIVGAPLVSIVIPTRGTKAPVNEKGEALVIAAVRSIMEMTSYRHFEIVVVADSVADHDVLTQLSKIAGDHLRVVTWTRPFNFSEKMNFGVLHATGEFVLLLNDDVAVLTADWLSSMLALAQRPNAGMVGAMLYYDDDTIQHAGHAYFEGSPTHIGLGLPRGSTGPNDGFLVEREVSGVTAACAMMPTRVFLEVGGFTALLPGNFNDVDLCLKVGWKGYDIYWTPHAELYHYESKSRDAHVHYYELDVIEHRWGLRLDDPRFWPGHPGAAH